jgi:hypothetical protein
MTLFVEVVCEQCGKAFPVVEREQAKKPRRFCGMTCVRAHSAALTTKAWALVKAAQ